MSRNPVALLAALFVALQATPTPARRAGVFEVRFVAEESSKPVPDVHVARAAEWSGPDFALSDKSGSVTLERRGAEGSARRPQFSERPLHADEVHAHVDGRAEIVIDSISTAPWAREVPLRGVGTLHGVVKGARAGEDISVVVPARSVTWPPCTGLERTDPRLRAAIGEDGRFAVSGVPANVPVTVWLGAGTYGGGLMVDSELVVGAEEGGERSYERPNDLQQSEDEIEPEFHTVSALAVREDGRPAAEAWFEIVPGGRYQPHRVGGGRWHVHGNRPCNHIEAPAGRRVVVGRSPDGRIGVASIEIPAEGTAPSVRVQVAPGGLVRIHAAQLSEACRVRFVREGLGFVEARIVPREIHYELVPAGTIAMEIEQEGRDPVRREIEVKAGEIVRVDL